MELKNNGDDSWPKNETFLKYDKKNSSILGDDVILNPQLVGEQNVYAIDLGEDDNLEPGLYKAVYYFEVYGKKYANELKIEVNIEKTIKKLIADVRKEFNLTETNYSDDLIKSALEDSNYNIRNAFERLITVE